MSIIEILTYRGPPEVEHISHDCGGPHLIAYSCGHWMYCEAGFLPYYCPECGSEAVAFHDVNDHSIVSYLDNQAWGKWQAQKRRERK